jgi:sterol desaturase/sphingolipid hydroxylase (fatty acid hydroxylase superfamily)
VAGFLIYVVVLDFTEYAFHRLQHMVPWLWSMHSLHHSDPEFDATTSVLHHWGPPLIKLFLISVPLGLVFKAPPIDLALYSLLGYYAYFIHANVRVDFGRFAWLLNSPSFHRVHHSSAPEHFDCNYANILTIFDVIFGSYRPARPGEWPKVGLGDGAVARTVVDLTLWPIRLRARQAA